MKIVSVGEITVDDYLRQNLIFVGGISLNFAVHAKRSGAEHAALVSCVGDKPIGQHVLQTLDKEGVDRTFVQVCDGDSAVCAIEVHDNADRFFPAGGYHLNVLDQLQLTDAVIAFINQHDVLMTLFSGHHDPLLSSKLVEAAAPHVKVAMDFGDWSQGRTKAGAIEMLDRIDLAFFSGDEQSLEEFRPIVSKTECQIVVTMGAAGSASFTEKGEIYQRAIPVPKAVDSTGCGDAFQGAFAVNYFQDGDVANALKKGAENAAIVLQHYAAFGQVQPPGD